jgi:hypothetical protein
LRLVSVSNLGAKSLVERKGWKLFHQKMKEVRITQRMGPAETDPSWDLEIILTPRCETTTLTEF